MNKFFLKTAVLLACLVHITSCQKDSSCFDAAITFVDDSGSTIQLKKPAKRIISLYSAHTENLFSLGLDEEIIGVYKSDDYPSGVNEKRRFDYRRDPEEILAVRPDLVLIRPFIKNGYSDFVRVLEDNGICVVSLYPDSLNDFDAYIQRLGLLTGKATEADKLASIFHAKLKSLSEVSRKMKYSVFFEATENNYRTVVPDSLPGKAIELAGGVHIAADLQPVRGGSSLAPFGLENLLSRANEIDVYVAQRGKMNPAISIESIRGRSGFHAIKAVKNSHILIMDECLISRPTLRYLDGVSLLCKYLNEIEGIKDER